MKRRPGALGASTCICETVRRNKPVQNRVAETSLLLVNLEVSREILLPRPGSVRPGQPLTRPGASGDWPVSTPVVSHPPAGWLGWFRRRRRGRQGRNRSTYGFRNPWLPAGTMSLTLHSTDQRKSQGHPASKGNSLCLLTGVAARSHRRGWAHRGQQPCLQMTSRSPPRVSRQAS